MRRYAEVKSPAYRWGATALFLAALVIVTALGFEHIGGYRPCPLCLQQRYAYYAGIPLLFLALCLLSAGHERTAALLFLGVAVGFLANAGLGSYHAGIEWRFWPGPDTCVGGQPPVPGGATSGGGAGFLKELANAQVIRCDEAAWRLSGLSFAGWNAVVSLLLALSTGKAAFSSETNPFRE